MITLKEFSRQTGCRYSNTYKMFIEYEKELRGHYSYINGYRNRHVLVIDEYAQGIMTERYNARATAKATRLANENEKLRQLLEENGISYQN